MDAQAMAWSGRVVVLPVEKVDEAASGPDE
jgi:hypothetical protein